MMKTALLYLAFATLVGTTGCSTYSTYVEVPNQTTADTALGRIVVYRNGIAYYERTAEVVDGKLTLTVPNDKVDDFLKSLTVADAATGAPLPVSFQTNGATRDNEVDMVVQSVGSGTHKVVLTYITEAPAWKPSYRVVVDGDGVRLQGWAVVDNTSGETWKNVRVGVGSSSALSFRYDLRTVLNVHRETLSGQKRFAVAPPMGGATHGTRAASERVLAAFDQSVIPEARSVEAPAYDFEDDTEAVAVAESRPRSSGGSAGRPERAATRKRAQQRKRVQDKARREAQVRQQKEEAARRRVEALAATINASRGDVVIEGYAKAGEAEPEQQAGDRANWLRNALIEEGVAPARLKVETKGLVAGNQSAVKLVHLAEGGDPAASDGAPVGESHFESRAPVTVAKGTSAMISILDTAATGNIVYLYDAESERGNKRFAFKSIRFKNPTEYTLESGPMMVYGHGRFVGEGLSDPIPPRSTALVPFALDRQIIVEKDGSTGDRISRLTSLQRGILRSEVQHTRTTTLKLTSVLHKDAEVFVKHSVRKGWKLADNDALFEHLGESHVFRVELAAGESKTLTIIESTPLVKTLDVRSGVGMELVRVYLDSASADGRFAEPLKKLLTLHTAMANLRQKIVSKRQRLAEFRVRMGEIQGQIESLAGLKGGRTLMKHLQGRLRDMSNRVQKSTIAVVDLQEELMLSRIRFQDGVAELSLKPESQVSLR